MVSRTHPAPDDVIHGEEAGGGADDLTGEFRPEDAVNTQPEMGQEKGEGGHKDDLAQEREKEGMTGVVQGDEGGLAGLLHGHEGEGSEIDPGAFHGFCNEGFIGGEDPDQGSRDEHDEGPHDEIDDQTAVEGKTNTG